MKSEYEKELENRDFDEKELCLLLFGKPEIYKMYTDKSSLVLDDPVIGNFNERSDMNRSELFRSHLKKHNRLVNLGREGKLNKINYRNYIMYTFPMGGLVPPSASHGMFEALIRV